VTRALIIDDERLARNELRRLLKAHPAVTVVGEAANAGQARDAIAAHWPDLLFLDIQMPGETGFDLLASLDTAPAVIFTTAYDAYALRAFEVNALDYLLKPIEPDRLAAALEKIHEPPEEPPRSNDSPLLTEEDRVFVKDGERMWFVRLGDVRLFESEGNYTRLYFGTEKPLVYRSLSYLEDRLDPRAFFRASRKHIITLRWVTGLDAWFNGGMIAHLEGGLEAELSRRQAQRFREVMSL
jgi:two-component system LytT family response regulator